MKFLLALAIMVTTSAYSQRMKPTIKCYEPAQQGGRGDLAYVLKEENNNLKVVYPQNMQGTLHLNNEGCLTQYSHPTIENNNRLSLCEAQGQQNGRLVPVDSYIGRDDTGSVYCERNILNWFEEDLSGLF